MLEWHKISLMVRVRANFLAEANIQWNCKEKRMERQENILVLAMGNRDKSCKTWCCDSKPFL